MDFESTMGETGTLVTLLVLLSGCLGNQGQRQGLCIQSGADKKAEEGMGSGACWDDACFTGKATVFLPAWRSREGIGAHLLSTRQGSLRAGHVFQAEFKVPATGAVGVGSGNIPGTWPGGGCCLS